MAAGLRSAYVPRPGESGEDNDGILQLKDAKTREVKRDHDALVQAPVGETVFDINATDFTDLADQLLA
jgi:hypothetical protein